MRYWANNPELYDEITIQSLPDFWRNLVDYGLLDITDIPEHIRDKAALQGEREYWSSLADAAVEKGT